MKCLSYCKTNPVSGYFTFESDMISVLFFTSSIPAVRATTFGRALDVQLNDSLTNESSPLAYLEQKIITNSTNSFLAIATSKLMITFLYET